MKNLKIIISHDVDHLYGREHWFRDLTYPKLWVRETVNFLKKRITCKEWISRCLSCFKKTRHNITEVLEYDKAHGVPSTFFFGMNKGLGLSYKPTEAKDVISYVKKQGFSVGVHGICYDTFSGICKEKDTFTDLMGFEPDGIRMHYVRYDKTTFEKLNKAGYVFDTTEFEKKLGGTLKNPYKVGDMWEFPLMMMDGYLPSDLEGLKRETLKRLKMCQDAGISYVTILFHDFYFSEAYHALKEWYCWLINTIESKENCDFISYNDAIAELER